MKLLLVGLLLSLSSFASSPLEQFESMKIEYFETMDYFVPEIAKKIPIFETETSKSWALVFILKNLIQILH